MTRILPYGSRLKYNTAVSLISEWGLNPGTFQVIVACAALLAAMAAVLAARAARRQVEFTRIEVENRNRPWIGLVRVEHSIAQSDAPHVDQLSFAFNNHGSLPCDRAHMMVEMWLEESIFSDEPFHTENLPVGTIFPNEQTVRVINGPLSIWTITFKAGFSGRFTYYLGNREYVTRFTGELDFSRDRNNPGITWRNTEAVYGYNRDLQHERYH